MYERAYFKIPSASIRNNKVSRDAERLLPALNEVGVELSGDPEVFEVQELQRR